MVRTSFLNEINQAISKSNFFDVNDFDVTTKEDQRAYTLQIQYRFERNFWYVAQIPRANSDSKISISFAPGEINAKESTAVENRYGLSKSIGEWLMRVKEELLAIPIYRQVGEQREALEEMLNRLKDMEDVAFTRTEADDLKVELDRLKEQLIEHIKTTTKNQADQTQKIQEVSNDVEVLKASVDVLSKPNWARAAITRFHKWTKDPDNRALLKDGVEVATKLLTGQVNGK
jgi:hypothetical protein